MRNKAEGLDGKDLIAGLVTLLLVLALAQGLRAQTANPSNSAMDTNVRLARLEQKAADAKSSADNAWMLTSAYSEEAPINW